MSKYSFNTFDGQLRKGRKGFSKHTETYRICDSCQQPKETVIEFSKKSNCDEYLTTCNKCRNVGKKPVIIKSRRSRLSQETDRELQRSHERLLDQALAQKPEITDLNELRNKYPGYDFTRLKKLQALNIKINAANDFLIEEQSAWLDPSSRPSGGIEYREDLFGKPFAKFDSVDKVEQTIRAEQADLD